MYKPFLVFVIFLNVPLVRNIDYCCFSNLFQICLYSPYFFLKQSKT